MTIFKNNFLKFIFNCVCLCHLCMGIWKGQKRPLGPLQLWESDAQCQCWELDLESPHQPPTKIALLCTPFRFLFYNQMLKNNHHDLKQRVEAMIKNINTISLEMKKMKGKDGLGQYVCTPLLCKTR